MGFRHVTPDVGTPLLLCVTAGIGFPLQLYSSSPCGEVIWINMGGGRSNKVLLASGRNMAHKSQIWDKNRFQKMSALS
jgi:hypothetical protein